MNKNDVKFVNWNRARRQQLMMNSERQNKEKI